ncbi:hypothetical protein, partial [Pseudomonas protegens]|uniref:hypothetical protein n=1 Tax=Pseudomonas protegens TaxID=380021 RepID=UPI00383B964E
MQHRKTSIKRLDPMIVSKKERDSGHVPYAFSEGEQLPHPTLIMDEVVPLEVSVFGTGYVGLVQAVALADVGHNVVCVDID